MIVRKVPLLASTAIASLEIVHAFLLQQDNVEKYITSLQDIEKFVEVRKTSSMRQSNINIDTYFTSNYYV